MSATRVPPPPPPPPPPRSQATTIGGSASWVTEAVTQAQQQPTQQQAGATNYTLYGQYGAYSQYQYAQPGYPYAQYYGWQGYGTTPTTTATTTLSTSTSTPSSSNVPPPPPPPPPPPILPPHLAPSSVSSSISVSLSQPSVSLPSSTVFSQPSYASVVANSSTSTTPSTTAHQQAAGAYPYPYGAYAGYNYATPTDATTTQQQQQLQQWHQYYSQYSQVPYAYDGGAAAAAATQTQLQQYQQQQEAAAGVKQQQQRTKPNRFAAAKTASSSAPTTAAKGDQGHAGSPPELNKWVERCFLSVKHSTTAQQRMEKALMLYIKETAQKGLMWSIDWANKPLLGVPSPSPSPSPCRSSSPSYYSSSRRGNGRKRSRWEASSGSEEDSEAEEGELTDDRLGSQGGSSKYGRKGTGSSHLRPHADDAKGNRKGKKQRGGKAGRGKRGGGRGGGKGGGAGSSSYYGSNSDSMYDEDDEARQRRQARFQDGSWKPRRVGKLTNYEVGEDGDFDFRAAKAVVGTCGELEKEYFRLNEVPHPSTVRPVPVLRKALEALQAKFNQTAVEERAHFYKEYLWTQLKAIRQDLLVQNIRDAFAVFVYETHARIALQCGDLNEYNQCQTQLMEHYDHHGLASASANEFRAYHLLYYVYLQSNPKFEDDDKGLIRILRSLKSEQKADPAVAHALKVRSASSLGNYHAFGRLYRTAPNLGAYVMDHFMDKERIKALQTILKAYKPTISRTFVQRELGFKEDADALDFMTKVGLVYTGDSDQFICCKASKIDGSAIVTRSLL